MNKKKIIIVGAGPGGLTAAMILAKRGFEVEIFEKESKVGGRNSFIEVDGFKFDIGPTFLMMTFILRQIFAEVDRKLDDYLKVVPLSPMYRLWFNNKKIDIFSDRQKTLEELEKVFPGSADGYQKFLKKETKRFSKIFACLQKDYGYWYDFLNPIFLRALPYIPFGQSVYQYLGNYFDDSDLKLAFTFQAKYLGMSPWQCPAFFIILPYLEHAFGIDHVIGGLSEISQAMAQVALEEGVKINCSSPVEELILNGKDVIGVKVASEKFLADAVVMNADFSYFVKNLVPAGLLKKWSTKNLEKKEYSCSTFMLYLGLNGINQDLSFHNVFFADNYQKNVEDIFNNKKLSTDFSFYIRNASILDSTLAPAGQSNIYVLVPVPNKRANINWSEIKYSFRDQVINQIKIRTPLSNIDENIVFQRIITPDDWQSKLNVELGATFNLAHQINQMLYFRPHNKFEELNNLYLVGGGTHPGSGLPTIYESGRISANLICLRFGQPFSLPQSLPQPYV